MAKEQTLRSMRVFRRAGAAVPKPVLAYIEKSLRFAGIRKEVRIWTGSRLLLATFSGAILLLLYLIIYNPIANPSSELTAASLFLGGAILVILLEFFQLYYLIADRANTVEKILPDFLLLIVSNLRAGMSPFPAFVQASRPEFGALHEEIKQSVAKMGGKASLVDALNEISLYFDSSVLRRSVGLFAKGVKSGGHLAKLLNSSADEVRRIQDLRSELMSSTKAYTIFLGFILVAIMPFLLSVSTQFVTVFLKIQSENQGLSASGSAAGVPVFSGTILVTPDQMVLVSVVTLILTSLLVSGLIGILGKGKALYGMRLFPIYAAASVIMYFIAKLLVSSLLSTFGS